jgi:hypothetical protein
MSASNAPLGVDLPRGGVVAAGGTAVGAGAAGIAGAVVAPPRKDETCGRRDGTLVVLPVVGRGAGAGWAWAIRPRKRPAGIVSKSRPW